MVAGMLIAAIHAVACIRYKADQVVTGTAINILMIGMPAFLSGAFFLSSGSTPQIPKEQLIPVDSQSSSPSSWFRSPGTFFTKLRLVCGCDRLAKIRKLRMPPACASRE